MVSTASNRKTFTLSLNLSSAKSSSSSPPASPNKSPSFKEHASLTKNPPSAGTLSRSPSSRIQADGPNPAVAPFLYTEQQDQVSRATVDHTPRSRMGFIRKVRKLSKALTDLPHVEPTSSAKEEFLGDIAEDPSSPESSPSTIPSAGLPKRSATIGRAVSAPRNARSSDVQRSRSLASLKPMHLLGRSSESVNHPRNSPVSPIFFSFPQTVRSAPVTPPPTILVSPTGMPPSEFQTSTDTSMSSGHKFLSTSPVSRSSSRLPPRPHTAPYKADGILSPRPSLRRHKKGNTSTHDPRRRLSLDLRSLTAMNTAPGPSRPTSPSIGIDSMTGRKVLKRSKSLWTTKRMLEEGASSDLDVGVGWSQVSPIQETGENDIRSARQPMSDKERTANIRRLRKLQQVHFLIFPCVFF